LLTDGTGRFEIDGCGNSALLSEAGESIARIQSIPRTQGGEIEGWVREETEGVDLSGIHMVIRCGSRVYRPVTDNQGYFHFRAPAGRYTLDFRNHEYYVDGDNAFWYGPVRFTLHSGESAALFLMSVRHPKMTKRIN
jgi:hypothetical protein